MSLDYKDKEKRSLRGVIRSFSFAINGIISAIKAERNMKIHLFISFLVIVLGFYLSLSKIEWIIIGITIACVLSLEMINTAIERVVDLTTNEYHPLAKEAKDISAGAVLIFTCLSIVIGIMIFFPKIIKWWGSFYY